MTHSSKRSVTVTSSRALFSAGLVVEDLAQKQRLMRVLNGKGVSVKVAVAPESIMALCLDDYSVDFWLVDEIASQGVIEYLFDTVSQPLLFGFGSVPEERSTAYSVWERRLYQKIVSLFADRRDELLPENPLRPNLLANANTSTSSSFIDRGQLHPEIAPEIWVLGASAGGPGAVKAFLDQLPSSLPVAFVYAQHIDPGCESMLLSLGRHSHFNLKHCDEGEVLKAGDVLVVPSAQALKISPQGSINATTQSWQEPYTPNINQVIQQMALVFERCMGVILFSGMQDDGAEAIEHIGSELTSKIPIWVQSPEDCMFSSMPEAALSTGFVDYQGTPKELAWQLTRFLQCKPLSPSSRLTVGAR